MDNRNFINCMKTSSESTNQRIRFQKKKIQNQRFCIVLKWIQNRDTNSKSGYGFQRIQRIQVSESGGKWIRIVFWFWNHFHLCKGGSGWMHPKVTTQNYDYFDCFQIYALSWIRDDYSAITGNHILHFVNVVQFEGSIRNLISPWNILIIYNKL